MVHVCTKFYQPVTIFDEVSEVKTFILLIQQYGYRPNVIVFDWLSTGQWQQLHRLWIYRHWVH